MDNNIFYLLVYIWIAIALLSFPVILRVVAPYGRHSSRKWGVMISNHWGWTIMELPALVVFVCFYLFGKLPFNAVTFVFFLLYTIHYTNRSLVFPFRLRTRGKMMPLAIVFMALGFNFMNGFINGYYLGWVADNYVLSWFADPRFILGITMFFTGMVINIGSDNILIHLRKPGETGYVIPKAGLFRWISCPNHFGEIVEWTGYAVMTWSAPGLAFCVWTVANLLPRALHHHRWYQDTFHDYPEKRKALIPYLL